jgi:hypothetical protein
VEESLLSQAGGPGAIHPIDLRRNARRSAYNWAFFGTFLGTEPELLTSQITASLRKCYERYGVPDEVLSAIAARAVREASTADASPEIENPGPPPGEREIGEVHWVQRSAERTGPEN